MRLSRAWGPTVVAVVLAAPTAFAQPDPMAPPPPPPPGAPEAAGSGAAAPVGPILPNMVPTRVGATLEFRADYSNFSDGGLFGDDLFLLGFNLYGQYIWPRNYGAYIQMPYYYASANDDSEQGLGNIELGGLYKLPQGPNSEVLLRGGFALDSAGNVDGFLAPLAAISPRLYDAYPTGFAQNWLRLEGSFRHTEGTLHLGASAGFDLPFGGDEDTGLDGLAKLAVSAGVDAGDVGLSIGYVMLQAIGTDDDDDNISGLNAVASFPLGPTMTLYGAFGLPDLENNIDEFDLWAIGAGVRGSIN